MPPRIRNCQSGSVKDSQRIHKRIRCFIIVRERNVTHKKCGCLLLRSENNNCDTGKITDPQWRLHLREFQKGHKY